MRILPKVRLTDDIKRLPVNNRFEASKKGKLNFVIKQNDRLKYWCLPIKEFFQCIEPGFSNLMNGNPF
jgi:hypothetical protein